MKRKQTERVNAVVEVDFEKRLGEERTKRMLGFRG